MALGRVPALVGVPSGIQGLPHQFRPPNRSLSTPHQKTTTTNTTIPSTNASSTLPSHIQAQAQAQIQAQALSSSTNGSLLRPPLSNVNATMMMGRPPNVPVMTLPNQMPMTPEQIQTFMNARGLVRGPPFISNAIGCKSRHLSFSRFPSFNYNFVISFFLFFFSFLFFILGI